MNLAPILRAHSFMRTEAPPEAWEADTDDVAFIPLLGEMIAAALRPGSALSALTLATANVVVVSNTTDEDLPSRTPSAGEYVAVTVSGPGAWSSDWRWLPGEMSEPTGLPVPATRLSTARALYAYGRALGSASSVTVFLARTRPAVS